MEPLLFSLNKKLILNKKKFRYRLRESCIIICMRKVARLQVTLELGK